MAVSTTPAPTTPAGTRVTFYGFGAFVGNLRSPTQIDWWPEDPASLNWLATARITSDLAKTPTAAKNGVISIAEIEVDDHRTDGGLTGIGPRFPQGSMVGAIWLRDNIFHRLSNQPRHPATSDAFPYELTSHVYVDGANIRRFFGFHARVVGAHGPLHQVLIFRGGRGCIPGERPRGPFWLDLAQDAHPVGPGATEIGPKPEGALFLNESTTRQLSMDYPKLPPGYGSELY